MFTFAFVLDYSDLDSD